MRQLCLLTDSGHGGMVMDESGKLVYTTGNKKRYLHPDDSEAFEGVINRKVEQLVIDLWNADGRPWVDVSSGNLDLSLKLRCDMANRIFEDYAHKYEFVYLSFHSNAGKGTGIEIFTSKGQTRSDIDATIWMQELEKEFPEFKFRKDTLDGDSDKEANYYVLKNTRMRAVLSEFLFFDNYSDWQKLQNDEILERYALATIRFLKRTEKENV